MPKKPTDPSNFQSTNWCFTWNNYKLENIEWIIDYMGDPDRAIAFLAYSEEVGDKGTPHLQGYLQMFKKCMLLKVSIGW